MIPIQELLNRIRWDRDYGSGDFEIGYYDRVEGRLIRIRFAEIAFPADDHFRFQIADEQGQLHNIPYHRVKEVYRNGELIWQRSH